MKKLFLIDAYAIIFRSYYALIRSPRINSKGMNTSAIMGFVNTLYEVLSKESPDYIAVAFDLGKTFRHDAYPPYKAQREETPEDIKKAVPYIQKILSAWHIPSLQISGFEADDIIGSLATITANRSYKDNSEDSIVTYMLTPDKDYAQLVRPGIFIYKPLHGGGYEILGEKEVCEKYSVSSTSQVIDLLALMGDSADNFPGCPGVGEKTAAKLINEYGSCENIIDNASNIKGALGKKISEHIDDIKISKFLATIKTDIPELEERFPTLLSEMERKNPDVNELAKIFEELEFKTLAKKILGAGGKNTSSQELNYDSEVVKNVNVNKSKKKSNSVNLEPSLFGDLLDEGLGEEKIGNYSSLKDIKHKYQLVDSQVEAKKLCDFLLTKNIVCFDTETTSKSAIEAKLVGMSFSIEKGEAWYVSKRGMMEEMVEIFRPLFENEKIAKVGQNMKYDIEVLSRCGIEVRGEKYDTMIAHYLLQPELRHNMDYMAETILNYATIHYEDVVPKGCTMADLDESKVCDYACEDADITLQLWENLEERVKAEEGLWHLFKEIEMPLVDVLADMELTGVSIDSNALREVSKMFNERMLSHEKRIFELSGHPFNINSPKQVGEILFGEMKIIEKPKKTKTGQFVTSEEVLTALRKDHEIVNEILEYRGLKKLVGTYVDALPKLVNRETGKIHTSFNQCVTATGRLSSSDPNLQNIPVRGEDGKEIRKCFIAGKEKETGELSLFVDYSVETEKCLFFSADYSQIELRVMAHLSKDEHMIEAFRKGYDIHAATAATVYGKNREEVTRDERTKAKRANFGLIYGISTWGLSQSLMIDRKESKALMDGFFQTFPKVQQYMEEAKRIASEKGYATTLLHRRRYLADINSGNATVRGFAERNAINAPIQGTAADIIKIAMIRIHKRFKEEGIRSKMILQVHDELNFSVYESEREKVQKIVLEEMENAYPLSVPLVADYGWGENWLEAH